MQPDNPLTARVTVNRFWQELFGAGIVLTTGDFGVGGRNALASGAARLAGGGLSRARLDVKKLLNSWSCRRPTVNPPSPRRKKIARDPLNKLLARGPRFRMDAEMVRDNALAASGLLVPKIGGPSVKPYQPDGVWEAVAMPEEQHQDLPARLG